MATGICIPAQWHLVKKPRASYWTLKLTSFPLWNCVNSYTHFKGIFSPGAMGFRVFPLSVGHPWPGGATLYQGPEHPWVSHGAEANQVGSGIWVFRATKQSILIWPLFKGQLYFGCEVGNPGIQRADLDYTRIFNSEMGWVGTPIPQVNCILRVNCICNPILLFFNY